MTSAAAVQEVYAEKLADMLRASARNHDSAIEREEAKLAQHYAIPDADTVRWVTDATVDMAVRRTSARRLRAIAQTLSPSAEPEVDVEETSPADRCRSVGKWHKDQVVRLIDAVAGAWSGPERHRADALVLQTIREAHIYALDAAKLHFVENDDLASENMRLIRAGMEKLRKLEKSHAYARSEVKRAEHLDEIVKTKNAIRHFEESIETMYSAERRGLVTVVPDLLS